MCKKIDSIWILIEYLFEYDYGMQVSISTTLNVPIFCAKIRFGSFYYIHVTRKAAETKRSYEKFARLTLMKLTAGPYFYLPGCVAEFSNDVIVTVPKASNGCLRSRKTL